jgi:hypothetical protein
MFKTMKCRNGLIALAIGMGIVGSYGTKAQAIEIIASSTFDSGLEGWTSNRPDEVSWSATGGNPGGYIAFDDLTGHAATISAPDSFLGDWSILDDNGRLELDFRLFNVGDNASDSVARVEISGPGGIARWSEIDGDDAWQTISIVLGEDNWEMVSGSWEDLLAEVTELKLPIETVANNGHNGVLEASGIDNVQLIALNSDNSGQTEVPEPMTTLGVALFGLMLSLKKHR